MNEQDKEAKAGGRLFIFEQEQGIEGAAVGCPQC